MAHFFVTIFFMWLFFKQKKLFYNLTHSVPECFEKLPIKKKTGNQTLNGYISKTRANSASKLQLSENSSKFLQNSFVFCTLYPRGYTAGGSAPYNPWCRCQWLAVFKELTKEPIVKLQRVKLLRCKCCSLSRFSYMEQSSCCN